MRSVGCLSNRCQFENPKLSEGDVTDADSRECKERTSLLYGWGGDFIAVGSRIVCTAQLKSARSEIC